MKKLLSLALVFALCLTFALADYAPYSSEDGLPEKEFEKQGTVIQTYKLDPEDLSEDAFCATFAKLITQQCLNASKGEEVKSVSLIDRVLTITIYLPQDGSFLPAGMYANGRANTIGELIAANDVLFDCWDSLILVFDDLTMAIFDKSDFDSIGLKIDSLLEQIPDTLRW